MGPEEMEEPNRTRNKCGTIYWEVFSVKEINTKRKKTVLRTERAVPPPPFGPRVTRRT